MWAARARQCEAGGRQVMLWQARATWRREWTAATGLTHLDGSGRARMVDVGEKVATKRSAVATARVRVPRIVGALLRRRGGGGGTSHKGDVLRIAELAGIQAAKATSWLIPLCHPVALTHVLVRAHVASNGDGDDNDDDSSGDGDSDTIVDNMDVVKVQAEARCRGETGVEMEALTAASVAALTVYDMCKARAKNIVIERVQLESKSGGRSGHWRRSSDGVDDDSPCAQTGGDANKQGERGCDGAGHSARDDEAVRPWRR